MRYFVQVHPNAYEDLYNWLIGTNITPSDYLMERVRVVHQHQGSWVTLIVTRESFYRILDSFDHETIHSQKII